MSARFTDPAFMGLRDWADAMVLNLEQYGNLGRLDDIDNWQDWAVQMLTLPHISGSVVPNPYTYTDWREWAQRLTDNLSVVP